MLVCRVCFQEKPDEGFSRRPSGRLRRECRACVNARTSAYRKSDPAKHRERAKRYRSEHRDQVNAAAREWYAANRRATVAAHLKYRFGLSIDDYDSMAETQNHLCLICQQPETKRNRLSVDHCHATGKIRGLLCNRCNIILGRVEDQAYILQRAAEYPVARQ